MDKAYNEALVEVVKTLVGPINPIGETNEDERRFENLKQMYFLIGQLIDEVEFVAGKKISHQYSVKRAGEYAQKILDGMERV